MGDVEKQPIVSLYHRAGDRGAWGSPGNKPGLENMIKPEDIREGSPEKRIFLIESRE